MNDRLGIGGNAPPSPIEMLRSQLDESTRELVKAREFWLGELSKVPEVTDAITAGKATQTAADIGKAVKEIEAAFKVAKAPYLEGGRTVDAYFKALAEPLTEAKNGIERKLTIYQRKIADEERLRRETVERAAREEAAKAAREAAERAAAMRSMDDLNAALEAEQKAAERAREAEAARIAAEAKAAELSRSRGAWGATSSLRTTWVHGAIDRATLDLEALRHFFKEDALSDAIKAYIKTGQRTLRGTVISEEHQTRIRG